MTGLELAGIIDRIEGDKVELKRALKSEQRLVLAMQRVITSLGWDTTRAHPESIAGQAMFALAKAKKE